MIPVAQGPQSTGKGLVCPASKKSGKNRMFSGSSRIREWKGREGKGERE